MKEGLKRGDYGCCPGHDKFPRDTYGNRRSKKARARGKQLENQTVRVRLKAAARKAMEEVARGKD